MNPPDHLRLPVQLHAAEPSQPVSLVLESARQIAAEGQEHEAAVLFLAAIEAVLDAGLVDSAQEVLTELLQRVQTDQFRDHNRARLLEIEGRIQSLKGRHEEARAAFQAMRSIGEELGDRAIVAGADLGIGNQAVYLGDLEEAKRRYRSAFDAWTDLGDYYHATRVSLSLATVARVQGNPDQAEAILKVSSEFLRHLRYIPELRFSWALESGTIAATRYNFPEAQYYFRRSLRYARAAGDMLAESVAIQNIGAAYINSGEFRRAIPWLRRGLRLAENIGAVPQIAHLSGTIGVALLRDGRHKDATESLQQAWALYDQIGDVRLAARVTADLGALAVQDGNLELGRRMLQEAGERFEKLGDTNGQLRVLYNLLLAAGSAGDPEAIEARAQEAIDALPEAALQEKTEILGLAAAASLAIQPPAIAQAEALYRRLLAQGNGEDTEWAARASQAAATLVHHGGYEASLSFYTRALRVYEAAGEQEMAFHVRNDRAIALTHLERFAEARREYELCLKLAARLENRAMELQASFNLGEMAHREGLVDEAIVRLRRAAELARELGDSDAEADALGSLGIAYVKAERWDEAREVFSITRDFAGQLGKPSAQAHALGGLASVAFGGERFHEAAGLYKRAAAVFSRLGDWQHEAEDLGGLLESLAALDRKPELERQAQRLIDLAQKTLLAPHASDALARSGRWQLRRGRIEDAAGLYAAAIALAVDRLEVHDPEFIEKLSHILLLTAFHARMEVGERIDEFYGELRAGLDNLADGLGSAFAPFIDEARRVAETIDLSEGSSD